MGLREYILLTEILFIFVEDYVVCIIVIKSDRHIEVQKVYWGLGERRKTGGWPC